MHDLHTFKKIHIKSGNISEMKKNYLERFSIFLNIKMSVKSKIIELNREFIATWREEQNLWDIMSPLYQDRNKKGKSLKRL